MFSRLFRIIKLVDRLCFNEQLKQHSNPLVLSKIMSNPESGGGTKFRFGSSDVSFLNLKDKAGSFSDLLDASKDGAQKTADNKDTAIQKKSTEPASFNLDQKAIVTGEEKEDQIFTVCPYFY